MIQQTACGETKKDQGRSSGFRLRNAGIFVENRTHIHK